MSTIVINDAHLDITQCTDLTHLGREKARADADYYKAQKQAEAFKVHN